MEIGAWKQSISENKNLLNGDCKAKLADSNDENCIALASKIEWNEDEYNFTGQAFKV